jgi:hypothetical protein
MLNDRIDRLVPNTDSASSMKINGKAPSFRLARALANRSADDPLGFAQPHVQNLRSFDVQERAARDRRVLRLAIRSSLPLRFTDELSQTGGCGLPDQGLTATRRSIEQEALRLRELIFRERVGMEQRIFDGFPDGFDRLMLPADLLPRHTGHFIEEVRPRLAIFKLFDGDPVCRLDPDFVAGFEIDPQ